MSPTVGPVPRAEWVRAGVTDQKLVWGVKGRLLWGLPDGKRPRDGPRGLIRLWSPVLTNGGYDLINFIAVEPVVRGRKGFSELEHSQLDGVQGKRLWCEPEGPSAQSATKLAPGQIRPLPSGAESLRVEAGVERFDNGAHVGLVISQHSDAPDEIEFTIHAEADSAPLDYCILTATMGNKARARLLWLRDGPVSSLKLYPDYKQPDFAPHHFFPLKQLHHTTADEILAAVTSDEVNPSAVEPFPGRSHWRYAGFPVTQYWKKPAGAWRNDLQVAVNGRYTYWLSQQPVPGGVAFENFEMRERFQDGQRFVFGITRHPPSELGFTSPKGANNR
ncbi:MAG: hypothetical protein NTW03_14740 [Verrucomicrobia bacterium]|nr:hypothetical protein [Verrucomicrobiota bacterium]